MTAIKNTKQRTPGITGITKIHLIEASRKPLLQFLDIFNACLNFGYFPDTFKTQKIIFIPKPKKKFERSEKLPTNISIGIHRKIT